MTKYHINEAGNVDVCRAKVGNCPLENFDTIEEAEQFKEKNLYNNVPSLSKQRKNPLRSAEQHYGGQFISKHNITLSSGVEDALKDLEKIGNPLIVGGAVRDSFIGADNKDIDIEVHGTDIETLVEKLKNNGYNVDEVGKQFGVLKVSKKGVIRDLDISVPRKENRQGAGHRSFEVSMDKDMTVEEAAERRDFTFNAVMYDHKRGVIVDPANGKEDFENKVMKHVSEKFAEDPLRVLRGFQFAARFDMDIDPKTAKMCKELRKEYKELSVERVQEEWGKFFEKSTAPLKGVKVLQETSWDDTVPGLKESLNSEQTQAALSNLPKVDKRDKVIHGAAIIASQMDDSNKKEFLNTSVIGAKEQNLAYILSSFDKSTADSTYKRKHLAKELARDGFTFNDYGKFSETMNNTGGTQIAEQANLEGIGDKPEADYVMGKNILEMTSKKPGPWMGKLLEEIRDKQYRGEFKNKEEALDFAKNTVTNE